MADRIFDGTVGALNTSLNLRLLRQNLISSNVANAETPDYKAKEMNFEESFRDALSIGNGLPMEVDGPGHMAPQITDPVSPEIFEEQGDIYTLDGNTVDKSAEMAKLAENQILYDASVDMLKKKIGLLKYSVSEGGNN
jgi:flagellar basal-body rod protein FlgB